YAPATALYTLSLHDALPISGGVLRAGDILFDSLRDSAFKHSLKINTEKLDLIPSTLGQHADVIGAATLWVNELFHGNRPINEIIDRKSTRLNSSHVKISYAV